MNTMSRKKERRSCGEGLYRVSRRRFLLEWKRCQEMFARRPGRGGLFRMLSLTTYGEVPDGEAPSVNLVMTFFLALIR